MRWGVPLWLLLPRGLLKLHGLRLLPGALRLGAQHHAGLLRLVPRGALGQRGANHRQLQRRLRSGPLLPGWIRKRHGSRLPRWHVRRGGQPQRSVLGCLQRRSLGRAGSDHGRVLWVVPSRVRLPCEYALRHGQPVPGGYVCCDGRFRVLTTGLCTWQWHHGREPRDIHHRRLRDVPARAVH